MLFHKLRKIILIFVAVTLMVFAILITGARVLTPYLNSHVQIFENWTGNLLHQPVKIGKLTAWWSGFHPELRLNNVDIFDVDKKHRIFHLSKLQISINPLRSLLNWSLQPSNIAITGIDLNIYQNQAKKTSFKLINAADASTKQVRTQVLEWLLQKKQLSLQNMRVTWYKNKIIIGKVLLDHLLFVNQEKQHIISGEGCVDQTNAGTFTFYSSFKGSFDDPKNLQVSLYAKVKHLELARWYNIFKLYGYHVKRGALNGQFWLDWKNEQITSVQSLLNAKNLIFVANDDKQAVYQMPIFSGNFLWKPISKGWKLTVDQFNFKINDLNELGDKFSLVVTHDADGISQHFRSNYFYLENLQFLFLHNNLLPKNIYNLVKQIKPKGKLSDLNFIHHGDFIHFGNYQFSAKFDHVATLYWNHIPGITNFSGRINLQPGNGSLDLATKNASIDFGKLFHQPLMFNDVLGHIQWQLMPHKGWLISSKDLSMTNKQLTVSGKAALLINPQQLTNPMISVLANYDLNDSSVANNYVPVGALNFTLAQWLDHVFVQGDGVAGKVILHGKVQDFPFDHHNGTFVINSQIRGAKLNYASGWPQISNVNANLNVVGRTLHCDVASGNIFNSQVKNMNISIPDIGKIPPVMHLSASIASHTDDIMHYFNGSELNHIFAQSLQGVATKGLADINLKMSLPINNPSQVKLSGIATLHQAEVGVVTKNLWLQNLQGKLLFTEKKLWSQGLQAKLFNHAANLQAQFSRSTAQYTNGKLKVTSYFDIASLAQQFHWPQFNFINGGANYAAELTLQHNSSGKENYLLHIFSDLRGLSVGLPEPLSKAAQQVDPFSMQMRFSQNSPTKIMLNVGDTLSAVLQAKFKQNNFLDNANLHFGVGKAKWQQQKGLYVDGVLSTFNWRAWHDFLRQQKVETSLKAGDQLTDKIKSVLRGVNLKIARQKIFGKKIINATYQIIPKSKGWLFEIENPVINGNILFPNNYPQGILQINLKKLVLTPGDFALNKTKLLDPADIPSMDINIGDFTYGQQKLGKVKLSTRSSADAVRIKNLDISSATYAVSAQGYWKKLPSGKYTSLLRGNLESNNIMPLLNALKIRSGFVAQEGSAQFNLNWSGIIYQPNLQQAAGDIYLHLGKGQITDIGEQADQSMSVGRILTLLSINRLLTMNFSDLFGKGYSFNKMDGALSLYNGKIDIKSLKFDGSVASIDILGNVNMLTHYLDLRLAITPYITSSVPIIAGIIGGPIVGVTAFLVNKIFGKLVDQISTYDYVVTGNWQHPHITKVQTAA